MEQKYDQGFAETTSKTWFMISYKDTLKIYSALFKKAVLATEVVRCSDLIMFSAKGAAIWLLEIMI